MPTTYCFTVSFPHELYESVLARCCLLGMAGCEEKVAADRIAFVLFFTGEEEALQASAELAATAGLQVEPVVPVENQDWLAKWRESMKPARLAGGFWVSPAWLPPPAGAKEWIRIEPKMAFGTGHHETTRLAAAAIITNAASIGGRKILDIGSGSGVLCFVADRCDAASCTGIEIDRQCRENMAENRDGNAASGKVRFCIGTLAALKPAARFDVVVMNMLITESAPLLATVAALTADGGSLVWSGILDTERDEAVQLAERSGFVLTREDRENEWWCGVFNRAG